MVTPKIGTEYVCGYCGTTLLVTKEGVGCLEDVICCSKPMSPRKSKKSAGRTVRKAAGRRRKAAR